MPDKAPSQTRRARLWRSTESQGIPLRAILVTVAVVVVTYMAGKLLYRLRDVVLLMAVSGFVALLLNPLVVSLQRWKVPRRGFAVAIVTFWAVLVFVGLAIAFGYPLIHSATHLADQLPTYVDQAEHGRGWIGQLIRRYNVTTWVQHNSAKIASFAQGLGKPALALGKGAISLLVALGTIFFLVLLLLLEGPRMRSWILANMTSERAVRVTRVSAQVNRAVTGYMAGNLLTSLIAGAVVFVTLFVLGVPFPFLWALWVALVDFLPMIGGALAGIPTVLFATAHSLTAGIVTLIVFLAYTQIENHVLNPVVMSKTVQINPLLVLVSILVAASIGSWIGGLFGGFVAALLAIPAAGAGQVIVSELWRDTAPPARAGPPGPPGAPAPAAGVTPAAVGTAPAGTAPAGTAPAGTAPAGTAPAGTAPAGTAPAGTAPAGTAPAGTAPAGTASAGTAPAAAETAGAGAAGAGTAGAGTAADGPAGADVAGGEPASVTKPAN